MAAPELVVERRAQLLRDAASLDPRAFQRNALVQSGDYAVACAQNWSPGDVDSDDDSEVPVLDPITQMAIAKDDIVVLSDGNCYSRSSIGRLVDQGVVTYQSGRAKLPLTNIEMTDLDYVLVDRDPPGEDSAATEAARLRTVAVAAATYDARSTRSQRERERQQRQRHNMQQWLGGRLPATSSLALTLGAERKVDLFERLLRELPNDQERACAIYLFGATAGRGLSRSEIAQMLDQAVQRATGKTMVHFAARAPSVQQCAPRGDVELAQLGRLVLYGAVITRYPTQLVNLFRALSPQDRIALYYETLRSNLQRPIEALTPPMVRDMKDETEFTDNFSELLFGVYGPVKPRALYTALDALQRVSTPYRKKLNLAFSLYFSPTAEHQNTFKWTVSEYTDWLRRWSDYSDMWLYVPDTEMPLLSEEMRTYGVDDDRLFRRLLDIIVDTQDRASGLPLANSEIDRWTRGRNDVDKQQYVDYVDRRYADKEAAVQRQ